MEFLLQLMAELFGSEPEQSKVVSVAETSQETVNPEIISAFSLDRLASDMEIPIEEGVIFDFIRFH